MSKRKPFVLREDEKQALRDLVSINDEPAKAYRKEMQARAEACREERS